MEPLIEVRGISKKFCRSLRKSMFYGLQDVAAAMVGRQSNSNELRPSEFWALNNINFTIQEGDALGLIGGNGSGKSTLLRIISGIFPPDNGEVRVRGRIGALIALGAGFHPHMTGRENVFLNGAILGMHSSEIRRKLGDIVDFAELGDFIDSPVATYSSGMLVRLGFSIAAHIEPDILVLDEILAVGDMAFKNKCYSKLAELQGKVRAFILVSHSLDMIRLRCNRGLWIQDAKVMFDGDVETCINKYESRAAFTAKSQVRSSDIVKVCDFEMSYDRSLALLRFQCQVIPDNRLEDVGLSISLINADGVPVYWLQSYELPCGPLSFSAGAQRISLSISELPLVAGHYHVSISIIELSSRKTHYLNRSVGSFTVPFAGAGLIRRGFIDGRAELSVERL